MKLSRLLILASMFIIVTSNFAFAQVKTKIFPDKVPSNFVTHKTEAEIVSLSPPKEFIDLKNKKNENENQFAVALPVNINLQDERFRKKQEEKNVFTVTLVAKGALSVSIEFSEFELTEGDVLSIFTKRELTDSITSNQNNSNKIWATRVYQGDTLTCMLTSFQQKTNAKLVIGKVNFGYKPFGVDFGNIGASAGCHVNVICPEGNGWENERNSVAMIVANGQESCTGSLIMNSCNTNTPYILTANHCLQAGSVPNWVFQFQTWSTDCFSNTGWREDIQFNGCVLRANSAATDFALLELNQTPTANSGIFYSGWSREIVNITSTTVLHHPAGDLMKISRDINPPVQGFWNGAQCWQLDLDIGHLQGGSSGGPYFNQNHQIIGQHFGRPEAATRPICDITITMGGRFALSWTGGGTNATRLSNWLDPSNSGTMSTNTTNINALADHSTSYNFVNGSDVICSTSDQYTYLVNGVAYTGGVTWSSSNTNIATIPPNGNPATVTKTGTGYVTITGTLCDGRTTSKQINVVGGVPTTTCTQIGGGQCLQQIFVCPTQLNNWQYVGIPGTWGPTGTGFHLQAQGGAYFGNGVTTMDITSNSFSVWVPSQGPWSSSSVMVSAMNSCGVSRNSPYVIAYIEQEYGCYGGYYYSVAPNPVQSTMSVTLNQSNADAAHSSFDQVNIYDQLGNLKITRKFGKVKTSSINVSSLTNGIYVVEISNGVFKERQQLIVQK